MAVVIAACSVNASAGTSLQLCAPADAVGHELHQLQHVERGGHGTTYLHTDALGSVVATVGPVPAVVSYSCPPDWTLTGTTGTSTSAASVINPTTTTAAQAHAMLEHFKTGADPQTRQFNQVRYSRALQQAIQRAWYRGPVKTEE